MVVATLASPLLLCHHGRRAAVLDVASPRGMGCVSKADADYIRIQEKNGCDWSYRAMLPWIKLIDSHSLKYDSLLISNLK